MRSTARGDHPSVFLNTSTFRKSNGNFILTGSCMHVMVPVHTASGFQLMVIIVPNSSDAPTARGSNAEATRSPAGHGLAKCLVCDRPQKKHSTKMRPILRNVDHDSLRFREHELGNAPGPLYTLLVGHKKFSKLKYQAMKPSVECISRTGDFRNFTQNQQVFF